MIMAPISTLANTIIGETMLRPTWPSKIRRSLAPMTLAARTNSCSRNDSTGARTIRATVGIATTVIARMALVMPGPRAATMAMANRIAGKANRISSTRMIKLSVQPP